VYKFLLLLKYFFFIILVKKSFVSIYFVGSKTVSAICRKNHYEEIDPMYCDLKSRPETGIFSCNQNPCPPRFV
jgi:hypothetical protein